MGGGQLLHLASTLCGLFSGHYFLSPTIPFFLLAATFSVLSLVPLLFLTSLGPFPNEFFSKLDADEWAFLWGHCVPWRTWTWG